MLKQVPLFLVSVLILSLILTYKTSTAELLKKGQSSEQAVQPYTENIEEYESPWPETTLREDATDDNDLQQYPYPDYPADDPGMTEVPMTNSAGPDDALREAPMTDAAGPDATLREDATDDSGIQERAEPYSPTQDLFAPKK